MEKNVLQRVEHKRGGVDVLVQEALPGRHRLAAVATIFDRLDGRARQQIEVADVTKEPREKSDVDGIQARGRKGEKSHRAVALSHFASQVV